MKKSEGMITWSVQYTRTLKGTTASKNERARSRNSKLGKEMVFSNKKKEE